MTGLANQSVHQLLCALAAKEPTPGGGAVAGLLAALSSSLGRMVLAYSKGKKDLETHDALHDECIVLLTAAMEESLILGDADAAAFEKVSSLWKLPSDDPLRIEGWNTALKEAIQVPMNTMELSNKVLGVLEKLVGTTSSMLASDLGIAAVLAESAARASYWNVFVNVMQMENGEEQSKVREQAETILQACKEKTTFIEISCRV